MVSWPCDACGKHACTVTLLPPFAPDPNLLSTASSATDAYVRLSVNGPVRTTRHFLPEMRIDLGAIDAAIANGHPAAMSAIDPEFAPCWCPTCELSYCADCWSVWVEHDEGFYDCTRGRCTQDHERILDD
jgi:hypothetical protein